MSKIILSKSKNKGKRLKVEMIGFEGIKDHIHHFASDVGQTFIDHQDEKKKSAWVARHSVNKNWDNIHSPIFYSKTLLWNTPYLNKNIRLLAKKLDTTIINRI
jgi:hypothetical protein